MNAGAGTAGRREGRTDRFVRLPAYVSNFSFSHFECFEVEPCFLRNKAKGEGEGGGGGDAEAILSAAFAKAVELF